jgi:hypothetical protein
LVRICIMINYFLNTDARVPFTIMGDEMEVVPAYCGGWSSYSNR